MIKNYDILFTNRTLKNTIIMDANPLNCAQNVFNNIPIDPYVFIPEVENDDKNKQNPMFLVAERYLIQISKVENVQDEILEKFITPLS